MDIDSTRAYRPLWFCFRVLAPTFFGASNSQLAFVFMMLLHLLVTVLFPVHLLLGQLQEAAPAELFKNLNMSLSCAACSLKHVAQLWYLPQIMEIKTLLMQLDECAQSEEEKSYYQEIVQCRANRFTYCIYISYAIIYILFALSSIMVILAEPSELLYLAWFPFDWRRSAYHYALAVGYQFLSICTTCLQALTNDIYTPLTLCYASGHMHLLGMRMSRLGLKQQPGIETQHQLRVCFQDFKLLMRLLELTRETVSYVQLVQLSFCCANLCVIVIYMLFYTEDIVSIMYNATYFVVVCTQLFPSCYFASVLAQEAERLPNAIFSSNWYDQSAPYRRNVLIFTELALRLLKRPVTAGGLITLNLQAFVATIKMAYSLFAFVVRIKDKDKDKN